MPFHSFYDAEKIADLENALLSLRDADNPDAKQYREGYRSLVGAYHHDPSLINPVSVCLFVGNLAARDRHVALDTGNFIARLASHDDACDALMDHRLIPQMRKFAEPPHEHSVLAISSAVFNLFSDHPDQFRPLAEGHLKKLLNPSDPFFHPETALAALSGMSMDKIGHRIDGIVANDIVEKFIAVAPNPDMGISAERAAELRELAVLTENVITRQARGWLEFKPERPHIGPTDAVAAWIRQHG